MIKRIGIGIMVLMSITFSSLVAQATSTSKPAIVLVAFGTSTQAFDTYKYFGDQVKKRFPDHEVRWAFTSKKVVAKLRQEQQMNLHDLPETLQDLKAQGFTKVAVQSLHIVPGEEWAKKVVAAGQAAPGLKIALGQPLLSSESDRQRLLAAVEQFFPADLKTSAVVLVAHGSPNPRGEQEYLALEKLLRTRFADRNVFLGAVEHEPAGDKALAAVKQSGATAVKFIPLMFVAGDHMENDIMGDKDSWKADLLASKPFRIEALNKGLGYNDAVVAIYLDHLAAALQTFNKK